MKYCSPTSRKLPKQKAAKGLHQVSVPPSGNSGDVLNSAAQGALAGSSFGPWGATIGGLAGGAMGLVQMGAADKAHAQAVKQNQFVQANDRVSGVDVTQDQRMQYAQGTHSLDSHKPIEVEKDELVFRKVGDKFRLKADFQKGKPHSQGGEDYLAQEGDIIFPGKQRGKVLEAYKGGEHSKLEGMRLRLPKDTNPQGKAASGADLLGGPGKPKPYLPPVMFENKPLYNDPMNRDGKYGAYPQALEGLNDGSSQFYLQGEKGNPYPYGVVKNNNGSYYRHDGIPQLQGKNLLDQGPAQGFTPPTSLSPIPTIGGNTSPSSPASNLGPETGQEGGLGNVMKYASVANNLIQGFSDPEKVQESYLDPVLQQYQDRSNPQRTQSNMVRNAQFQNARGASGGNIGNLRANQQIAEAENYGRRQEIDNREQGIADQVRVGNTNEVRRVKGVNLDLRNQYQALNGQARANQQAYKDAAFGQLTSLGQANEQDAYKRSRDGKLDERDNTYLQYLNQTTHYTTDGKGGPIEWNPNGVGGYPASTASTTTKEDTDIYGRKKSSTSTTTKPTLRRRK